MTGLVATVEGPRARVEFDPAACSADDAMRFVRAVKAARRLVVRSSGSVVVLPPGYDAEVEMGDPAGRVARVLDLADADARWLVVVEPPHLGGLWSVSPA